MLTIALTSTTSHAGEWHFYGRSLDDIRALEAMLTPGASTRSGSLLFNCVLVDDAGIGLYDHARQVRAFAIPTRIWRGRTPRPSIAEAEALAARFPNWRWRNDHCRQCGAVLDDSTLVSGHGFCMDCVIGSGNLFVDELTDRSAHCDGCGVAWGYHPLTGLPIAPWPGTPAATSWPCDVRAKGRGWVVHNPLICEAILQPWKEVLQPWKEDEDDSVARVRRRHAENLHLE